jgi:hypothetical protein
MQFSQPIANQAARIEDLSAQQPSEYTKDRIQLDCESLILNKCSILSHTENQCEACVSALFCMAICCVCMFSSHDQLS